MAGRQGHVVHVGRVPGADDVTAAVGIGLEAVDQLLDLVDALAVRRGPGAPLLAIDGAEVAVLVGPFVPDADAVVFQPADIGLATEEPQQLDEDRARVQLLGGQKGEALGQVKTDLTTEDAERPGAGAVVAAHAVVENVAQQVEILPFGVIGGHGLRRSLKVFDLCQRVHAANIARESPLRQSLTISAAITIVDRISP
ncbi:hypothetical protein D3C80_1223160 [compost metagenome]